MKTSTLSVLALGLLAFASGQSENVNRLPPQEPDLQSPEPTDILRYNIRVSEAAKRADVIASINALSDDPNFPTFSVVDQQEWKNTPRLFYLECTAAAAEMIADMQDVQVVERDEQVFMHIQWGNDRIDQPNIPLDNEYSPTYTGQGQFVYVIDTGVRHTHTEFGGRAINGIDLVDNDNVSNDGQGHGTHCASSVGGRLYGVATGVTIVGVRVLDSNGSGYTSTVIAGVNWAVEDCKSRAGGCVLSLSLGGYKDNLMNEAINNAFDQNVIPVVAAGNENDDACSYSPASATKAVTVGSSTSSDSRSWFSNHGSCVDIFGPGSYILGAAHTSDTGTKTLSGTSMATPHVAGAVAMLLEKNGGKSANAADIVAELLSMAAPNKLLASSMGFTGTSPNLLLQVHNEAVPLAPTTSPTPFPTESPTFGTHFSCDGTNYEYEFALFGAEFGEGDRILDAVAVSSGNQGCSTGDLSALEGVGKSIAVIQRGTCDFVDKVRNAMAWSGVVGVVIVNDDESTERMDSNEDTSDITIPVVMVPLSVGQALAGSQPTCGIGQVNYITKAPTQPTNAPTQTPTDPPTPQPTVSTRAPTSRPTPLGVFHVDGSTYDFLPASFGPEVDALVEGPAGRPEASNHELCEPTGVDMHGQIAMVNRGSCMFFTKAINAQNAGAVAVVVANNVGDSLVEMGYDGDDTELNIPAIFIGFTNGARIQKKLDEASGDLNSSLGAYRHFTGPPTTSSPTPPTNSPTPNPTRQPTTKAPTRQPTTLAPTTAQPTKRPTTPFPTRQPTTQPPTVTCTGLPMSECRANEAFGCQWKKRKCIVNASFKNEDDPCSQIPLNNCDAEPGCMIQGKKRNKKCVSEPVPTNPPTFGPEPTSPLGCDLGTFNDARDFCEEQDMKLCSVEEIKNAPPLQKCYAKKGVWTEESCSGSKVGAYLQKKKKSVCAPPTKKYGMVCCKLTV